jgi:uncharacterized protein
MNLLLGGAAVYGLVVGGLYMLQDNFLFPRGPAAFSIYPMPPNAEALELETADGHRILGHLVPASGPSRGLIIGFAGNAWNASDFTVFLTQRITDFDVVVFHYRGYQPSEGKPGEEAFFADALLVHDRMIERLQPQRVFAAGFSLGSGVAAYLASQRALAGVLLVTPFDSIEAVAKARYRWAPVGPLLKHRFRSDRYLSELDIPAAVIMAGRDRIVPPARSQRLVEALRRPVLVETVTDATHNSLYDDQRFDELLRRALERLYAPPPMRAPANEAFTEPEDSFMALPANP